MWNLFCWPLKNKDNDYRKVKSSSSGGIFDAHRNNAINNNNDENNIADINNQNNRGGSWLSIRFRSDECFTGIYNKDNADNSAMEEKEGDSSCRNINNNVAPPIVDDVPTVRKKGFDGLREMGFVFRLVLCERHSHQAMQQNADTAPVGDNDGNTKDTTGHSNNDYNGSDGEGSELDDNMDDDQNIDNDGSCEADGFNALVSIKNRMNSSSSNDHDGDGSCEADGFNALVNIKNRMNSSSSNDHDSNGKDNSDTTTGSNVHRKNKKNVLKTIPIDSSCWESNSLNNNNNDFDASSSPYYCLNCCTRLFYCNEKRRSYIMITEKNRQTYIKDGQFFLNVSNICQELVQERLLKQYNMKFLTIPKTVSSSTNDTTNIQGNDSDNNNEPLRALVSNELYNCINNNNEIVNVSDNNDNDTSDDEERNNSTATMPIQKRPTLVIITGKGISRMGILSVKHLLCSGIERGSALHYIDKALKTNDNINKYHVILVDPNAYGTRCGMDIVDKTLNYVFTKNNNTAGTETTTFIPGPLYFLAHSAGGGYLVRYLVYPSPNPNPSPTTTTAAAAAAAATTTKALSSSTTTSDDNDKIKDIIIGNINGIVFTDSTHRIQWSKNKVNLHRLLQSSKCIYIRNNSLKNDFIIPKEKTTGEDANMDSDHWWISRFGSLHTVWAGTNDHSYICYKARHVIWHFIHNREEEKKKTKERTKQQKNV